MSIQKKKILLIALLVLNMAAIFFLSAQPANVSTEQSDLIVSVPQQLYESAHPESIGSERVYLVIQFIVRKTAHLMEFALLCVWATMLLRLYQVRFPYLLGSLFTIIYAATDEFHQTFVPGRDGKLTDLAIDAGGAILAALIVWCFCKRKGTSS